MIPSGSPAPIGGAQSVGPSLMRTNSRILGGAHNNSIPSQPPFSSVPMPRAHFNSNDLPRSISNVPSLGNHSFGNQMVSSGGGFEMPPLNIQKQGSTGVGVAEIMDHPETNVTSVPTHGQQFQRPPSNQQGLDPPQSQQRDGLHNFQQQFPSTHIQQLQHLEGLTNMNTMPLIKLEPQMVSAQMSILQQQQQQIVNSLSRQRTYLQQQLHHQNTSIGSQVKPPSYEPGICSRRLTYYMYHQQHRPEDNSIEFWRKFISEYFAPNAKKRWCVSLYGSVRQTTGVFPQDAWHCEICSCKPGRGFEASVEVLPRLCQIKYESGTLEELLYVDMPREYLNASGQIVLDYAKAIQESVFEQLRVLRDGQLRIVFNQDLKIASWEFCARRHEEFIPKRTIIQQVTQLGEVAHKCQAVPQTASNLSSQDLQIACNSLVASARQLAKAIEVPLVNDLGYTKRYVRCLQISEVVNRMKDLIDYSRQTGTGPMDSLINFPKGMTHQLMEQKCMPMAQNLNQSSQNLLHPKAGVGANNSIGTATSLSPSTPSINTMLLQNCITSRRENPTSSVSNPYGGENTVQIASASSSNSAPNPSSSNNNSAPTFHISSRNSFSSLSSKQPHESDPNDSRSSMQQILQEMLISSSTNGVGSMANELRGIGGVTRVGNGMAMSGRIGINNLVGMSNQQHHDLGSGRLLGGLGAVNGFNSHHFD